MSNLNQFWQAIELLPTLAAVEEEWRSLLGVHFSLAESFLRPKPNLAESYPNSPGRLALEVIQHGDDDYVGVCPETGSAFPLRKQQLIVYEVNRVELAQRIAQAFELTLPRSWEDWEQRTQFVGWTKTTIEGSLRCFLGYPLESNDVQIIASRLIAEHEIPFVLFVPTRQWVRRAVESLLKLHQSHLIALTDTLQSSLPGIFRAINIANLYPSKPASEFISNQFRCQGKNWTITYNGKTVHPSGLIGLKYIHLLIASKRKKIDAATLKALAASVPGVEPFGGMEIVDTQTIANYRAEIQELYHQLDEAEKLDDLAMKERCQKELEILREHLESTQGFGKRIRLHADGSAKHRTSITNAISRAIHDRLEPEHPDLARHLDTFIQRGTTLSYEPEPDVIWDV